LKQMKNDSLSETQLLMISINSSFKLQLVI